MKARPIAVLAALAALALSALAKAADDRPVKATPLDETSPVAGGGYFAWAQNSRRNPDHFDAFVQRGTRRPVRVNAPRTEGRPGGIFGRTLVYSEAAGGDSDIRFFNLRTRRRLHPPPGVNTADWEAHPTLSGDWLLFDRRSGTTTHVLLRNLRTGEEIELGRPDSCPSAAAGQVSGRYAVWRMCRFVFVYDLETRRTHAVALPAIFEAFAYAPSVTRNGDVYFAFVGSAYSCARDIVRVMTRRVTRAGALKVGNARVVVTLPRGTGVRSTYATGAGSAVAVYYERTRDVGSACDRTRSDIHKLVDTPHAPSQGTRATSTSS